MAVIPRWCLRIDPLSPALETASVSLLDCGADPAPRGAAGALRIPVEPDPGRLADQVCLGYEAPDPAVLAVVTIVAHHQILSGRNHAAPHRAVAQQCRGGALTITTVVAADFL